MTGYLIKIYFLTGKADQAMKPNGKQGAVIKKACLMIEAGFFFY